MVDIYRIKEKRIASIITLKNILTLKIVQYSTYINI